MSHSRPPVDGNVQGQRERLRTRRGPTRTSTVISPVLGIRALDRLGGVQPVGVSIELVRLRCGEAPPCWSIATTRQRETRSRFADPSTHPGRLRKHRSCTALLDRCRSRLLRLRSLEIGTWGEPCCE